MIFLESTLWNKFSLKNILVLDSLKVNYFNLTLSNDINWSKVLAMNLGLIQSFVRQKFIVFPPVYFLSHNVTKYILVLGSSVFLYLRFNDWYDLDSYNVAAKKIIPRKLNLKWKKLFRFFIDFSYFSLLFKYWVRFPLFRNKSLEWHFSLSHTHTHTFSQYFSHSCLHWRPGK